MFDIGKLVDRNGKYQYGLLLLLLIFVICGAFSISGNDDFDSAKKEVSLRRIGHEILLQSGDSTSRVLPVKKIGDNEYQISFEKKFTFQPDSLVKTTERLLAKDPLTRDYIVNVRYCNSDGVMFGYAISKNKKDNIVACSGRVQPRACYMINIKFKPTGLIGVGKAYLFGGLSFLTLIGFVFLRSDRPKKGLPGDEDTKIFTMGSVLFDAKRRKLQVNNETTDLTGTETRVLLIFALSPNEIIERSRLQKEIWEDEGVIVGRSLDMFISKLRKKLEIDPKVNIVSIRGKGYKLEITN